MEAVKPRNTKQQILISVSEMISVNIVNFGYCFIISV